MIQQESILEVTDNSGARTVKCIKVLGGTRRRYASVGDIIVCSIREALPNTQLKGKVVLAVIVRTKDTIYRDDGTYIKFDRNSCVLLDEKHNPKGSRIFGAVARELREKNFQKIISLAEEVV